MRSRPGKKAATARPAGGGRVPLNYYRSGGSEPTPSPFAKKSRGPSKARKFFVRGLDLLVLIVILGILIYSLLVQPKPKLIINDTSYHPAAIYQQAAAQQLNSFTNHNKISLNEQSIIQALQKQFPEISSGSVQLPLLSETPVVRLNIARPSLFLTSGGTTYIIDDQGAAAATANQLPKVTNLTLLTDQSGFADHVGQRLLSAQSINFINRVLAQLKAAKVPIKALILPRQAQELDLQTSDHGYYTKFYMGGDPLLQSGQFLAARNNFNKSGNQPPQYLDVRVPGRVYYQ